MSGEVNQNHFCSLYQRKEFGVFSSSLQSFEMKKSEKNECKSRWRNSDSGVEFSIHYCINGESI